MTSSAAWAVSQLSQLLPLDEDSIKQVLDYTSTLPKEAAAEHLKDILGDSAKALEFISSYNSRREAPAPASSASEPPKSARKPRQKKPPLNRLPPPRRPEDYGNTAGAYKKKDEDDYMAGSRRSHPEPALSRTLALSEQPDTRQLLRGSSTKPSKPPPSAAGPLISDLPNVHTGSRNTSRTSSPAPKTKINVPGGASMHGASTTLEDLVSILTHTCNTRANLHLPGLRHPHSRAPNQPLPQQLLPNSPPLHLPRNPPPSPSSSAQLPQLRQNNLRKRRHRPLHILQPSPPHLLPNSLHDRLPPPRARPTENELQQRLLPPRRPLFSTSPIHNKSKSNPHTFFLLKYSYNNKQPPPLPSHPTPRQAPRLPSRKRPPHPHHRRSRRLRNPHIRAIDMVFPRRASSAVEKTAESAEGAGMECEAGV